MDAIHFVLQREVVVPVQLQLSVVAPRLPGVAGSAQVVLVGETFIGQHKAQFGESLEVALVGHGDHRDLLVRLTHPPQPLHDALARAAPRRVVRLVVDAVDADADPNHV